jgi:hypothetical protein
MEQVVQLGRRVLPLRVKRTLRAAHREVVFRRALKRFSKDPDACSDPGPPDNPILRDLIYGWGNEGWSALSEYLAACIRHALISRGPILECGAGLSTVLVGIIATRCGRTHWVLEHAEEWATKVQRCVNRYKLDSVVLSLKPLRDYGAFCWYDPPLASMPESFSLVICDGPPGSTRGGRYGLVPVMRERLGPGCVVLVDDASRKEERAITRRWEAELGASLETLGHVKPYIKMTVRDSAQHTH